MWTKQEVEKRLIAIDDGKKNFSNISETEFSRLYSPHQCRLKVDELSNKVFSEREDNDILRLKDMIQSHAKDVSLYFTRPAHILQDRLTYLETSRRDSVHFSCLEEKENLDFLAQNLHVEKRVLLVSDCQICIDQLIDRVSNLNTIINLSKESGIVMQYFDDDQVQNVFYHALSKKNVVVYVDIHGMSTYGARILRQMRMFPGVPVVGSTRDKTKLDDPLLELFPIRYKLKCPDNRARSDMLNKIFIDYKVDDKVSLQQWSNSTHNYCLHSLEKLVYEARALSDDQVIKDIHLKTIHQNREREMAAT